MIHVPVRAGKSISIVVDEFIFLKARLVFEVMVQYIDIPREKIFFLLANRKRFRQKGERN